MQRMGSFLPFLQDQVLVDVVLLDTPAVMGLQETQFPAHRVVLARNSGLLRSKFANLKDGTCKIWELLRDTNTASSSSTNSSEPGPAHYMLPQILHYLYSGATDIHKGNVLALLQAALMFQIPSLKSQCCDFLRVQTDDKNIFALTAAAEDLGLPDAERTCIPYV